MTGVGISFDGRPLAARAGESVAAALAGAGIDTFRHTRGGDPRGLFCGMGVCQDCLVEVDGRPNQRACMTKVATGMVVRSQGSDLPKTAAPAVPVTIDDIRVESPEVLVVGAGPGGLSAAIAARRAGADVVVLDERKQPGGQYFKQLATGDGAGPDRQHLEGKRLIEEALGLGVRIQSDALVWGAFEPLELAATISGGTLRLTPERLIVATGAYERGVPFPGWTLPGVMTTGAAQTLWRTARRLPGRRVLVAGNGPLNLQVASELLEGGAAVAGVVELAARPGPKHAGALAGMAIASPRLLADGMRYLARLRAAGVPILYGAAIAKAERQGDTLAAYVRSRAGQERQKRFAVDALCLGYGFEPSNEMLRALGAAHDFDAVRGHLVTRRDDQCRTSVDHVYALGDCTRLGGARVAMAEGTIAGYAAAESVGRTLSSADMPRRSAAQAARARHLRFQKALWTLFAAPRLTFDLAEGDTLVCRCEEVTLGALQTALDEGYATAGNVKRRTRAGMGRCQGRYCGPLIDGLVAESCGLPRDEFSGFAPRIPLRPVAIGDLVRSAEPLP